MVRIAGLIALALLAFYVGWPVYSGYRIKTALDTDNAQLLGAKIDFDSVRASLTPAVTAEIEKSASLALQQSGAGNEMLLGQLKAQLMPRLVQTVLVAVVKPETILRIYRDGGDYKATLSQIIKEKTGGGAGLGGLIGSVPQGGDSTGSLAGLVGKLGGAASSLGMDTSKVAGAEKPASAPAPAPGVASTSDVKSSYSLANIKRFSVTGPLGFAVGFAKDDTATEPDVTVDMAFRGGDWKIVGITPKI